MSIPSLYLNGTLIGPIEGLGGTPSTDCSYRCDANASVIAGKLWQLIEAKNGLIGSLSLEIALTAYAEYGDYLNALQSLAETYAARGLIVSVDSISIGSMILTDVGHGKWASTSGSTVQLSFTCSKEIGKMTGLFTIPLLNTDFAMSRNTGTSPTAIEGQAHYWTTGDTVVKRVVINADTFGMLFSDGGCYCRQSCLLDVTKMTDRMQLSLSCSFEPVFGTPTSIRLILLKLTGTIPLSDGGSTTMIFQNTFELTETGPQTVTGVVKAPIAHGWTGAATSSAYCAAWEVSIQSLAASAGKFMLRGVELSTIEI